jgi:very-short-patch-repair endonuclease
MAKAQRSSRTSTPIEDEMLRQATADGTIPTPEREHRFHPDRNYRFDLAWPELKLGMEIDGGIWMPRSGHTSGKGYTSDREKDAEALCLGWLVLRVTADQVKSGQALHWLAVIIELLKERNRCLLRM